MTLITTLSIREYDVKRRVDYLRVGQVIDHHLLHHHPGKAVIRAVVCDERKETLDELVERLKVHGTDRTNPAIKGLGYHKHPAIEFFAGEHDISAGTPVAERYIRNFYEKPLQYGGQPLRISAFLLYDQNHVVMVPYQDARGRIRADGFRFVHPDKKQQALKGIVKIMQ